MMSFDLEALRRPVIKRLLKGPFDLRLAERRGRVRGFRLEPSTDCTLVAEDASGGVFARAASGAIVYVSSEGQAGLLAPDLASFLALVVALPYWQDLLKFSGGGKLAAMRRVVPFAEHDLREAEPEIEAHRRVLERALSLPVLEDAVAMLHDAVASEALAVVDPGGEPFESLFGTFTVRDNPMWKSASAKSPKKAASPRKKTR